MRKPEGALTEEEQRIVKAMINQGRRNQDVQDIVNRGRIATVNSARITEVKQDPDIEPATEDELRYYEYKKTLFDYKTGLNYCDDERLVRAREAMILAVQTYNNPAIVFKTEVFSVLAIIAWTYLLHEFLESQGTKIVGDDGRSLVLSQMIQRDDIKLSKGARNNLESIMEIRNTVEHKLLALSDGRFYPLYQACCLNFEKAIVELFGKPLSLSSDLGVALQFSRLSTSQIAELQNHDLPEHIAALDARLDTRYSEGEKSDLEYQFRVIYTLDSATKKAAHFQFVRPESAEGQDIHNVLVKYETADKKYPYKPKQVCQLVSKNTGHSFSMHNHIQAMYKYKARPKKGAKQPEQTNKKYCIFHPAHKDYTYSNDWVEFLCAEVSNEEEFDAIKAFRIR
ncbi:DUF3644 domain-containing protein [Roseospira visakhapatnamensis]|uniref:DUF3644 domain-containing protein n=1 Tax=Roseospira visakhapatnamensis TaxID=390880 RepID=A0A7W6WC17_9PROT|nr:DUF3644 domain-containing protein [Roseospira visakhapatnamensis]MBB4268116.1 hypothetical protein [Roseospira visakhapatnamensis]